MLDVVMCNGSFERAVCRESVIQLEYIQFTLDLFFFATEQYERERVKSHWSEDFFGRLPLTWRKIDIERVGFSVYWCF